MLWIRSRKSDPFPGHMVHNPRAAAQRLFIHYRVCGDTLWCLRGRSGGATNDCHAIEHSDVQLVIVAGYVVDEWWPGVSGRQLVQKESGSHMGRWPSRAETLLQSCKPMMAPEAPGWCTPAPALHAPPGIPGAVPRGQSALKQCRPSTTYPHARRPSVQQLHFVPPVPSRPCPRLTANFACRLLIPQKPDHVGR
jgi:hypothetical protein